MLRGFLTAFLLTISTVVVARGLPDGAVRLSADEVKTNITGNTEQWRQRGAAYYAPHGAVQALWKGNDHEGTWWVKDDGTICIDVRGLGGESCWEYYRYNDSIHYYWNGDFVLTSYKKGNRVKDFYQ